MVFFNCISYLVMIKGSSFHNGLKELNWCFVWSFFQEGSFSSYSRTPAYGGSQTPLYREGSKTPMHGSQTPMYDGK